MKRLSVVILGFGLLTAACAGESPSGRASEAPQPSSPMSSPSAGPEEGQVADGAIAYAASELTRALADDVRFASVEVLEDDRMVVHWEGTVDAKLQDARDRFPNVDISIQTTSCSPGKLRDYGRKLLAEDPAVNLVSVSPDGSSLQITLDESLKESSDVEGLERKYSEGIGCPVTVQFGGVAPISG